MEILTTDRNKITIEMNDAEFLSILTELSPYGLEKWTYEFFKETWLDLCEEWKVNPKTYLREEYIEDAQCYGGY